MCYIFFNKQCESGGTDSCSLVFKLQYNNEFKIANYIKSFLLGGSKMLLLTLKISVSFKKASVALLITPYVFFLNYVYN